MTNSIIGLETGQGNAAASASQFIKDSDTANFVADVIEESKNVPVLVDFWAPWCGPCKQLGPIIEKAVANAGGAIKLVKVNVDENQAIAQQMRVQSIPAVFAFVNGQPVDGFMGAKPEGEINEFIAKLINGAGGNQNQQIAELLQAADQALEANDIGRAAQIFSAIMQADDQNIEAITGLARCQIAADDLDAATKTMTLVPETAEEEEVVKKTRKMLQLALNPVDDKEITRLAEKVEKNPDDLESRFALASLLNDSGKRQEALEHLFYIIQKDRGWNDEAARKKVLAFFEEWGHSDEATIAGRKKLSSILFS